MSAAALLRLAADRAADSRAGLVSVCSAHPVVLEATLRQAARHGRTALVEATCNQVNQDGGYTGLTPAAFRTLVRDGAAAAGLSDHKLILGGDHLGPNPWRNLPAAEAMARAAAMVAAYAEAGFAKLHLDCSMGCVGEPEALDDPVVATRAASLAAVAETAAERAGHEPPVYVIGTEVPPPGGAHGSLHELAVTGPDAAQTTLAAHAAAFRDAGIPSVMERVVGLVVQPGVEFGDRDVAIYRPERAAALSGALPRLRELVPNLVFEAHSTDYQPPDALAALVRDGFAILKVGPALTFALREALYSVDALRAGLVQSGGLPPSDRPTLRDTMEALMLAGPRHWRGHYRGTEAEVAQLRHEGLSDRIRYYWAEPAAEAAVAELIAVMDRAGLPQQAVATLSGPTAETRSGTREILLRAVEVVLDAYAGATREPD